MLIMFSNYLGAAIMELPSKIFKFLRVITTPKPLSGKNDLHF